MITENQKVLYNRFKKSLIEKNKSPFDLVISSKSQTTDFAVLGVKEDTLYKFVRPGDRFRIPKWIKYHKDKAVWSGLKRKLVLVHIDKDYTEILKEEVIQLN